MTSSAVILYADQSGAHVSRPNHVAKLPCRHTSFELLYISYGAPVSKESLHASAAALSSLSSENVLTFLAFELDVECVGVAVTAADVVARAWTAPLACSSTPATSAFVAIVTFNLQQMTNSGI